MSLNDVLADATRVATLASFGLYVGAVTLFVVALMRRRRAVRRPMDRAPSVSVLKPLAGVDEELAENLASFAALDYPDHEILFGVASRLDPAAAVARRFLADNPRVRARLVVTDAHEAVNPKVAQLLELERHARGDVLVISDSNVRVGRRYLDDMVAHLARPEVGLVTSVVAGVGEESLGAALENLQLAAATAPGVVASEVLTPRPFTVGKSMAMRRRDLVCLGGFRRVSDVLAEDHALGTLFRSAGFELATELLPVENRNVSCGIRRTLERHTRWAKMRRAIAPWGFFAEPIMSPVALATLAVVAAPSRTSTLLLVVAALAQTAGAFLCAKVLRGSTLPLRYLPLEVVRCYVALGCWGVAFVSREVSWRGKRYVLASGSKITPAPRRYSRFRAARA